jgi:hypothetical protein
MSKWKIDVNPYCANFKYGLFRLERRMLRDEWQNIEIFKTREEARAFYEKIKDLPEYLD